MTNISSFVYKDGEDFYFDPENYTDNTTTKLSIDYEDGDFVKWEWENQTLMGILREVNSNLNLFLIENVTAKG
jgi:hypothetical protein